MIFELGKYYKHVNGRCIHLCGMGDTDAFGTQYLVEETDQTGHSMSIMSAGEVDVNSRWIEIGRDEWVREFFKGSKKKPDAAMASEKKKK